VNGRKSPHSWFKDLESRVLARFNHWFTSQGGVYQTLLITLTICTAERVFPHLDPHGFWLLYWLTVYSAITQPALAYSTALDADTLHKRLDKIELILENLHNRP